MRIRTIKPEFWTHEGLSSLSEFSRLLAIALLNWADDEGYFMANPILIRGQVFPFLDDSKMIPRSLQDLSRVGWIQLGRDDQGRDVGMVMNFAKHQRVDKPKPSCIKGNFQFQDASKTNHGSVQDTSKEEGKGKEGKGKEGNLCPLADVLAEIWNICPSPGKSRSSKKQVADAWKTIPAKDRPDGAQLLASFQKWVNSLDWTKDEGQYVPALHLWFKNRKWEVEPMPMKDSETKQERKLMDGFGV